VAAIVVRVTPRAAADRIGPYAGGALELRVTRPAADGEATEAARRLVAAALGVAPSSVRLVTGARSRLKRFEVSGVAAETMARTLERYRRPD
jgi:uncharacterized protein YggU (UPF0235/DUF167 family)